MLSVTLSARVDNWQNYDGRNLETTVATGLPTPATSRTLPDRSDTVVSPRAARALSRVRPVSALGSSAPGFRAPTLNELYRQFRVGAVLTLANDQLGPERLVGGELGVRLAPTRERVASASRGTTTAWRTRWRTSPSPPTRQQRQNLGRTRIWGWQNDVEIPHRPRLARRRPATCSTRRR